MTLEKALSHCLQLCTACNRAWKGVYPRFLGASDEKSRQQRRNRKKGKKLMSEIEANNIVNTVNRPNTDRLEPQPLVPIVT